MTGTVYLSSQAKQIRKVNNAILEFWNGLDLIIIERVRNLHAETTATIDPGSERDITLPDELNAGKRTLFADGC